MPLDEYTLEFSHLSHRNANFSPFSPQYQQGRVVRSGAYSAYRARFGEHDFQGKVGINPNSWATLVQYDGKSVMLLFSEESARRVKRILGLDRIRDLEQRTIEVILQHGNALGIRLPQ